MLRVRNEIKENTQNIEILILKKEKLLMRLIKTILNY